jgi:hypothetical protein
MFLQAELRGNSYPSQNLAADGKMGQSFDRDSKGPESYEAFVVVNLHCACVALSLPQDSAETSKTRSKRKSGF